MHRRDFVISAGAAMTAVSAVSASLGSAMAQEAPETAAPEAGTDTAKTVAPKPFGFEDVAEIAREMAANPFKYRDAELIGTFGNLTYDQYRGIRFRRDRDPWAGGDFTLDLLPPGSIFHEPVGINLVENGVVIPVKFDAHMFDFDPAQFPDGVDYDMLGDMGWSGFRIRTPLNRPDVMDEVAVFQGASYFRAVARGLIYGISSRGLAIDTAEPQGEEFPRFSHFWIEHPDPEAPEVTVRALLESASCTGAFEFVITPGETTVMQTRCTLFPRRVLDRIGIAPLTSMFWFGPADAAGQDDYRPAVHDSDGLQMITGAGQWLWRVLSNPAKLQISAFMDDGPRGFGLIQRPRSFLDYQDAEANYEHRPSAWIRPMGDWGKGNVSLIEIPVDSEFHDNIVSYWQPSAPLEPGNRTDFAYTLAFGEQVLQPTTLAQVVSTRSGVSINNKGARSFFIDFDLAPFEGREDPQVQVNATDGRIDHPYVLRLPQQGLMRVAFEYTPEGAQMADLSAVLKAGEVNLSETWLFRWSEG